MRPIVASVPVAIVIAAQTWLMAKVLMHMVRSRRCAEAHAPRALRDVLCMALGGLQHTLAWRTHPRAAGDTIPTYLQLPMLRDPLKAASLQAVSYTHLTLPTILRV